MGTKLIDVWFLGAKILVLPQSLPMIIRLFTFPECWDDCWCSTARLAITFWPHDTRWHLGDGVLLQFGLILQTFAPGTSVPSLLDLLIDLPLKCEADGKNVLNRNE